MPKYNQEIVKLTKIIGQSPINTLWIYGETVLSFSVINETHEISISTDDKTLSGWSALLVEGNTQNPLPIGTYSIGTYSTYPSDYKDYTFTCGTAGYIKDVFLSSVLVPIDKQYSIPNQGKIYKEWALRSEEDFINIHTDDNINRYIGASFSNLIPR